MDADVGSTLNAETVRKGLGPDGEPHPWRRYFARLLDLMIGGLGIGILVGFLLAIFDRDAATALADFTGRESRWFNSMVLLALAMIPNALQIGYTGTSIGKWLFGFRVTDGDGHPIGPGAAFKREIMVWFRGLGLGIPIVSLVTLIMAYNRLQNDGKTSWDRDMSLHVRCEPRSVLATLVAVVLFAAIVALSVL